MFRVLTLIVSAAIGLQPMPLELLMNSITPSAVAETEEFEEVAAPAEDESPAYGIEGFRTMWVTAYSSTPEETDDTPFVTASNTEVRHGVVATNDLPFGTKVRIPDVFGDEIFTVEDRMHRRKDNWIDIWMPTKTEALRFGIKKDATVVVIAETDALRGN